MPTGSPNTPPPDPFDHPSAEFGLGETALHEAMARWARKGLNVYFTNVSRNDEFRDCELRYYWDYVHGGAGVVHRAAEEPAPLWQGTALHAGAEVLCQAVGHGKGAVARVEAAKGAALDSAAHILESPELSPTQFDAAADFRSWIGDVLDAGAHHIDAELDDVWATEELVWAALPHGEYDMVVLMGRPDAVVVAQGQVWHLQHKSRSRETDLDTYAVQLAFGSHETFYGAVLRRLVAAQAFGPTRPVLPYGGSKLAVWLKQARPDDEPVEAPKGLRDAEAKGHIEFDERDIARADCTAKQWEAASKMWQNWREREERRLERLRSYEQRVVQFVSVDLDADKIELGARRLYDSARDQLFADLTATTVGPTDALMPNTKACWRYGRPCPHLESQTCGGWETYDLDDPDAPWVGRPHDYVDQARATYGRLQKENRDA